MKAPVGLLSRRPVCEANAACSARQGRSDFDALEPGGDCSLLAPKENQKSASDFDALDPRERGYSPLSTPKRMGSIQKKLAASLNAFLCSAISRPLSRCGGSSPQGSGCALSVTFGDTLSPFLSLRDIFPRPGEVFQRERQEALPLRPWLPFKRKARSVPSTLLALPLGELANPKGLTERVCFSPSCGFPAGATLPQGASDSRCRLPLRPFP